jgi:hypothetical protein
MRLAPLLVALAFLAACASPAAEDAAPVRAANAEATGLSADDPVGPVAPGFNGYWYAGEAELASYDLQQARYGNSHEGTATLIFVTEDFSRSKQVKLDDPAAASDEETVSVLKLNATRAFLTGIYPYSTMTSVFMPVSRNRDARALKVTTSVQEWCGHVWQQMNLADADRYRVEVRSYFESAGDSEAVVSADLLEDEVWTAIRLNPEDLPEGSFSAIPGTLFQRFRHTDAAPQRAEGALSAPDESGLRTYTLTYPEVGRSLEIRFRAGFPHEIEGWTETQRRGGGEEVTTATLRQRTQLPYWQLNRPEHEGLRASELGLQAAR